MKRIFLVLPLALAAVACGDNTDRVVEHNTTVVTVPADEGPVGPNRPIKPREAE